jgi:hypothetical protein
MYAMTDAGGFSRSQVAFLTAYQDRQSAGFKKTVAQLAWNSVAWFVSEPEHLVIMSGVPSEHERLTDLNRLGAG